MARLRFSCLSVVAVTLLLLSSTAAFAPLHRMAQHHHQQQKQQRAWWPMQMTTTLDLAEHSFEEGLKFVLTSSDATADLLRSTGGSSLSSSSMMMTSLSNAFGAAAQSVVTAAQDEAVQATVSAIPSLQVAAAARATLAVDPVVSKTLAELERQLSNPPSFPQVPIPQGKGLAQPLTESMEQAMAKLQQYQNYETSTGTTSADPFVKLKYGFEVKSSVLDTLDRTVDQVDRTVDRLVPYVEQISNEVTNRMASNNAAIGQQLYANANALQHTTADQFTALSAQLQQLALSPSKLSPEALKVLKLDELGGWYAGALLGFLLLAVYNSNNNKIDTITQGKVVRGGVSRATSTTPFIDSNEKERLESMVAELTQAVNALSAELRELRSEKSATDYALQTMQDQVRTVQTAIDTNNVSDGSLRAQLEATIAENKVLQSQLDAAKYEVATLLEVNEALAEGINALDVPVPGSLKPHPPSTPPLKVERQKSQLFPQQDLFFFAK